MSYFPEDISFMSKEELKENGIKIPKDVPDTNIGDTISRQAAIDALDCINGVEEVLRSLPSVQPEPAIPLSWIDEQIERLKGLDNAFATLTAMQISGMVKKWRDEQNDRTD